MNSVPGRVQATSIAGRLFAVLFSAIFAVAFGGFGIGMGLWPLLQNASAAWQVRQWQPVPATVLHTQLDRRRDSEGAVMHEVRASYRYVVAGQPHVGHQVGLDERLRADNIGDWHEQWHRRLLDAQARGEPITAWVNPAQPEQAVLEREVRWALAAFRMPFGLLFTAIGAIAAWAALRAALGRPGWPGRQAADVARADDLPSTDVRPQAGGHAALWIFGVVWLLFSLAFVAGFWARPWVARLVSLGFFAIGCGIVAAAARETIRARRFQGARVNAVPRRLTTGEAAQLQVSLPASAQAAWGGPAATAVALRLGLHHIDDSGSSRETRRLWDQTRHAQLLPLPDGSARCSAQFELPAGAPPSGAIRHQERAQWLLEVLDARQRKLASFELSVHQGASVLGSRELLPQRADWDAVHAVPAPGDGERAPALPATVQVQEDAAGWRLVFRRHALRTLTALAVLGAAALLWQWLLPLALGGVRPPGPDAWRLAIAASLLALALHWASQRWIVQVSDAGLHIDRSSWLVPRLRHLADGQVRGVVHKLSYITGSGAQAVEHHALWANTPQQGSVKLTPAVAQAVAAQAVAWHLQRALAHHRGRFVQGTERLGRAADAGLGKPAWVPALAWLGWMATVALLWRAVAG